MQRARGGGGERRIPSAVVIPRPLFLPCSICLLCIRPTKPQLSSTTPNANNHTPILSPAQTKCTSSTRPGPAPATPAGCPHCRRRFGCQSRGGWRQRSGLRRRLRRRLTSRGSRIWHCTGRCGYSCSWSGSRGIPVCVCVCVGVQYGGKILGVEVGITIGLDGRCKESVCMYACSLPRLKAREHCTTHLVH